MIKGYDNPKSLVIYFYLPLFLVTKLLEFVKQEIEES